MVNSQLDPRQRQRQRQQRLRLAERLRLSAPTGPSCSQLAGGERLPSRRLPAFRALRRPNNRTMPG